MEDLFRKSNWLQKFDELSAKLKPFSYRVLKDDCLDLPKKTFMKRIVQLTPDQKKLYDQMKKKHCNT